MSCSNCGSCNEIRWETPSSNKFTLLVTILSIFIYGYFEIGKFLQENTFLYVIIALTVLIIVSYSMFQRNKQSGKVVTIPESRVLFLKKQKLRMITLFFICVTIVSVFLVFIYLGLHFSPS